MLNLRTERSEAEVKRLPNMRGDPSPDCVGIRVTMHT